MTDYCIRYIELPYASKGVTVQDAAGFYNIYINSLLSYDEQKKAVAHELAHVFREDFDPAKSLELVERYRPALSREKPAPRPRPPAAASASFSPPPVPAAPAAPPSRPSPVSSLLPDIREITTVGQLIRLMTELEMEKRGRPIPCSSLSQTSIDIFRD